MDYKFTKQEYDNLGRYLLFELGMEQVLSESKIKSIDTSAKILQESFEEDEVYSIVENRLDNLVPMKINFDGSNITISHGVKGNERLLAIPPSTVASVWEDAKNQKAGQILIALGIPNDEVQMRDNGGGYINNRADKIRQIYNERYASSTPNVYELVPVGQRSSAYWSSRRNKKNQEMDYEEPGFDQINRGQRGRQDVRVRKINQQEIMSGEFYRDMTHISKSSTSRWVRLWKKNLNAVQPNKKTLLGKFIGRTWKKTFLLGYQVNRTLFFEVWYNSMDSSFSVYDKNGIELTHPIPTLQESIKMLIRTVAQESPGDRDIFSSGRAGAEMASSLNRVLGNGVEKDIKQIRREDEFLQNELRREKEEAKEKEVGKKNKKTKSVFGPNDYSKVKAAGGAINTASQAAAAYGGVYGRGVAGDAYASASKTAQAAVAAAAIGASDARFTPPKENNITSKTGQTSASIDRSQLELEDMQIRQYRSTLGYIMGRLSDEQGKLKDISDDPDILSDISVDPTLSQIFNGVREYKDIAQVAARAEKAVRSQRNYVAELMALGDVDFSKQLKQQMKIEGREFATSTPKMMNIVLRKLRQSNRGMFESALDEATGWNDVNQRYRDATNGFDAKQNEKEQSVSSQNQQTGFNPSQVLDDLEYDRQANKLRGQVKNSPYNKQILIGSISDSIEAYDVTRIRQSEMKSIFSRMFRSLSRGRKTAIQSPIDKPGFFSRLKQAFFDQERRVDFVIGYSLNDIVNIEVWYITEIDPGNSSRMISSFYVYDVSAQKILRSHLPYYRNAAQVISAKLGVSAGGL